MAVADDSFGINYIGFRRTINTEVKAQGAPGIVDHGFVRIAQLAQKAERGFPLILVVEPHDANAFILCQVHQVTMLIPAGRTPFAPHVQQGYLALEHGVIQHPLGGMEVLQLKPGTGLPISADSSLVGSLPMPANRKTPMATAKTRGRNSSSRFMLRPPQACRQAHCPPP